MGRVTGVQWADHTFNTWVGCEKVSAGCKFCYASVDTPARISSKRGLPLWGADAHRQIKAESGWAEPGRWFRAAVRDGVRRRVFCLSQGDIFEDRRDLDAPRERLWKLIEGTAARGCHDIIEERGAALCDQPCEICGSVRGGLDWLLLTKRPENALRLLPSRWLGHPRFAASVAAGQTVYGAMPPNVWVGASVENQEEAVTRTPHLVRIPARVRFLSLEPLLGPVDVRQLLRCGACGGTGSWIRHEHPQEPCTECRGSGRVVELMIVGGESGPHARPCDVAWIRDLRDQGRVAGVPVFVKQLGAHSTETVALLPNSNVSAEQCRIHYLHHKGGDPAEWPTDLRVRELPGGAS